MECGRFQRVRRKTRLVLTYLALLLVPSVGAAPVPPPETVLGFRPGTDYKLADYETIVKYFKALSAASNRVVLRDIGPTAEGRTMIAAIITSEANQKRLERYREISRRLALARGLDEAQARSLASEGKAVIWIDSGLHATEVAPAQHSVELAFRVATEETPEMRRVRDDVILILVPVMNPDGLDKTVAWYRRNLGTPYEVAPMVELYHKYVGHDNNRDWYMFNMPESRNVAKLLYEEWFPQVVYNHHQSAPFPARIFVPPFDDPMNPNIPPQIMRGVHAVGDAITARLEHEGKVGAISRIGFDTWWDGGMRTAPYFHNMVGILTETALWRYATPRQYGPAELPKFFNNGLSTENPSTFYPSPWKGGWWRLRDAVDYIMTASLATLDLGSKQRFEWLHGIYLMGTQAIEVGGKGDPYAYVISPEQWDPGSARKLVEALKTGGVEVYRATTAVKAGDQTIRKGAFVVPMAQPFRASAKDLLEVQHYPDRRRGAGGPPIPPYDITGWTLPAQLGVEGAFVARPFEAALEPADPKTMFRGRLIGSGGVFVIGPRSNDAFLAANRVLGAGGEVRRATQSFAAEGESFEPGTFLLTGGMDAAQMTAFARDRGLVVTALGSLPPTPSVLLHPLRIGIYKSWVPSIDEGWTRWVLEQFEFPYKSVVDADIRKTNLKGSFDVLVLPDATAQSLLDGNPPGTVPPEFAGGLGLEGAFALKRFVREGGTLVALSRASDLPLETFGLGLRNVLRNVPTQDYFCPGALLRVSVDVTQPLAWGLPKGLTVFVENGPAFAEGVPEEAGRESPRQASDGLHPRIVARYLDKDVLHSGWLLGEGRIARMGALVEVPLDKGRVILVGFRSQFRGQPHATFKVLFNALTGAR